jgi:predicted RND superfamily exporter protein
MAIGFRDRVETGFESWGRLVAARPVRVLLASLFFVVACVAGLPRLTVDVSFEAFLRADDPVRVAYDSFREQFGRDERVIVSASIKPPTSGSETGDVFDEVFLEKLRLFHEAIDARVPYVNDITSLVNARNTRGEDDTLLVEDFLDPWPTDEAALARLRTRALANPLFLNNVISADALATTIVIEMQLYSSIGPPDDALGGFDDDVGEVDESAPLLTSAEEAEFVHALREVIAEFEGPDFLIHVSGSTIMIQDIAAAMSKDMPRFLGLALASIAILLFLLFRRVVAVVAPLIVVILSVVSTFGLMGWSGTSIHVPTQILPSFLVAVGVGDSVHLLTIFFERIRAGEGRADSLAHALGHSGLALVLTSVTTAAGLASFASAGIAPVAALGLFAPIGVMIALVLSLTLLPALLQIVPLGNPKGYAASAEENALDRILTGLGRFATRRPLVIVSISTLMIVLSVISASRISLSHDPLGWLGDDSNISIGTRYIDRVLKGSVSFEILLETDEAGGIRQPDTLARMARVGESFEQVERDGLVAGQTTSLADVVMEINRALEGGHSNAYMIPDQSDLISQELLLFENSGSDDLEDLVDTEYRIARIAVRMPWRDAVGYKDFLDSAEAEATTTLQQVGRPSMTGVLALLARSIGVVVTSLARSYVLAFAIITPLMIMLLGNLRLGLLSMIPNLTPIVLTLGLMGAFGLPLDAFSLLVGGIALGLAVDDTIHFMHNYRRYRDGGSDLETAVETTLLTTGRAMLITTVVLSTGFFGFVLSSMHNLTNLGILVSFAVTVAFFADVLLAPALLALFDRDEEAP